MKRKDQENSVKGFVFVCWPVLHIKMGHLHHHSLGGMQLCRQGDSKAARQEGGQGRARIPRVRSLHQPGHEAGGALLCSQRQETGASRKPRESTHSAIKTGENAATQPGQMTIGSVSVVLETSTAQGANKRSS